MRCLSLKVRLSACIGALSFDRRGLADKPPCSNLIIPRLGARLSPTPRYVVAEHLAIRLALLAGLLPLWPSESVVQAVETLFGQLSRAMLKDEALRFAAMPHLLDVRPLGNGGTRLRRSERTS